MKNKVINRIDINENQWAFQLFDDRDNKLLRIQVSKDLDMTDRLNCAWELDALLVALRKRFCGHTKKKSHAPWGTKFELDNFHVRCKKQREETWISLIEVFKKRNPSDKEKKKEMGRNKLKNKILTAEQIRVTLDGWEKIDILFQKQIQPFLNYIVALQEIVTEESQWTLEQLKTILETEKKINIRRWTLMWFLTLTQHQFGWK